MSDDLSLLETPDEINEKYPSYFKAITDRMAEIDGLLETNERRIAIIQQHRTIAGTRFVELDEISNSLQSVTIPDAFREYVTTVLSNNDYFKQALDELHRETKDLRAEKNALQTLIKCIGPRYPQQTWADIAPGQRSEAIGQPRHRHHQAGAHDHGPTPWPKAAKDGKIDC